MRLLLYFSLATSLLICKVGKAQVSIDTLVSDTSFYAEYKGLLRCFHIAVRFDSVTYIRERTCRYTDGQLAMDARHYEKEGFYTRKVWYPNGNLAFSTYMYYDNRVGYGIEFYENGTRKSCGGFYGSEEILVAKDGLGEYYEVPKHGKWSFYREDGSLIKEEFYEKGIVIENPEPPKKN